MTLRNWGSALLLAGLPFSKRAWAALPHPKPKPKPVEWSLNTGKGIPTEGLGLISRWNGQGSEAVEPFSDGHDDVLNDLLSHQPRRR